VFKGGTRASDKFFTFIALPNSLGHARLGIAVSKKSLRRAVDRNRAKRIIRESFRHSGVRNIPMDIVVLAKNPVAGQTPQLLSKALTDRWPTLIIFHNRLNSSPTGNSL
jgi:ribonuclease P protein component